MTHLPKIGHENIIFECKEQKTHQSENVLFDKTLKNYVLKVGPTNLYSYHNTYDLNVKGSKIYIQVYLMEKLKFMLELQNQQDYFRIVVNPNLQQAYIKKVDEVKISSAFILTNKWISLSFDVESFFKSNELQLKMLSIHSQCRLRKIYEANQINSINDGQCLVQKICEKRILELLPQSLRAQSEKIDIRKNQTNNQQRRLSTISNSQEKYPQAQSEKKTIQVKQTNFNMPETNKQSNSGFRGKSTQQNQNQVQKKMIQNQQKSIITRKQTQLPIQQQQKIQQQFQQPSLPHQLSSNRSSNISAGGLQKQMSQECLLEKTIKLATGLQVIEEVNSNKPPIYNKQNSSKQTAQTQLQKKAVQSFLRHTQEFQNQSHFSHDTVNDAKTENDQGHKQSQLSSGVKELYYDYDNSEYQTKYGKFSSTFTRPLGLSSYNHRLVSQQSTNQQPGSTNEYFYLSSQQIEQQNQSPNQTVNEIEEQIEVPELRSKMTEDSFNSLNGLQIKQEDSSEELAVSKFE